MGRILGPLLSVCLTALLVGVVPATPQPAAHAGAWADWRPPVGPSFNLPRTNYDLMFRNETRILDAINHARRGSVIRIATYSFDRNNVADALIRAHNRGVRVQLVLNNHQWTRAMGRVARTVGRDRSQPSFLHVCVSSCRGTVENLHTKIYLFGMTGSARYVSMTGSHNLTGNAARNQWNDLFTVRGNKDLWFRLSRLWGELRDDQTVDQPYRIENSRPWQLQILPYPNYSATNDPVMRMLSGVRCSGSAINNGRTLVRLNMAVIGGYRGEYLAEKVRRLHGAGCDVRVIYGAAMSGVRKILATRTRRGYVPVHVSGYDTKGDGLMDLYGHEKSLVVSGRWGRSTRANYAWTSSGNWTQNGIRGDELIFRIAGRGFTRRYMQHFNYMWSDGSHLAAYIPYGSRRTLYTPLTAPQPALRGPAWEND